MAFRLSFMNKCDEMELLPLRRTYQRCFDVDLMAAAGTPRPNRQFVSNLRSKAAGRGGAQFAELAVSVGLNRIADHPAGRARADLSSIDGTPEEITRHMRGQVDMASRPQRPLPPTRNTAR